jgi:hypothetical protein
VRSGTGDFYRAAKRLRFGREEAENVAALLGLDVRKAAAARVETSVVEVLRDPDEKKEDEEAVQESAPASLRTRVVRRGAGAAAGEPEWYSSTDPFPLEQTRHRRVRLQLDPLLPPRATRGIVTTLAATEVAEGIMDLDRIVSHIARGEVVRQLFRKKAFTTRNGLQLLIDRSDAMTLFARDAVWLERQIVRIIGAERVQPLRFSDLPQRGAGRAREEWTRYTPPAAGVPVMVLSDFGIGASAVAASTAEWLEFARLVREADCPTIGVVPYPPWRWPDALAQAMTLVQWDRLHARAARAAMRLARKAVS